MRRKTADAAWDALERDVADSIRRNADAQARHVVTDARKQAKAAGHRHGGVPSLISIDGKVDIGVKVTSRA